MPAIIPLSGETYSLYLPQIVITQNQRMHSFSNIRKAYGVHYLHNVQIGYTSDATDPILTYHFLNPETGTSLRCEEDYFSGLLPVIPRGEFVHSNRTLYDSLGEAVRTPQTVIDWQQEMGNITAQRDLVIGRDVIGYVAEPGKTRRLYHSTASSLFGRHPDPDHDTLVLFMAAKYAIPQSPFAYYKGELDDPVCRRLGMPVLDWYQLKRTR